MDNNLTILGDVHLGRKFRTGVPLHRIGHREAMMWDDFETSLMVCITPLHVQTGDLFDTFAVEEAIVLQVATMYRAAAVKNPNTCYIIYRGNHDASRDSTKASSFDVLAELLKDVENIRVMKDTETIYFPAADGVYGFIPWHPFKSAEELALEVKEKAQQWGGEKLVAVFGHWDIESFGGSTFNLVPTHILKDVTDTIYTGHIHLPSEFEKDGVKVVVVGSMQPYSHSEDKYGAWYKTVTYQEFMLAPAIQWQNFNVRILLAEGESLPFDLDCLSLITKRVEAEDVEPESIEVSMDHFDLDALFNQSLTQCGVGEEVASKILARFKEMKNA